MGRAALWAALAAMMAVPVGAADRVHVTGGTIEGLGAQASGVREFRGIPYAAPPIGPLRWRAPQPVQPWSGVRAATAFAPRCMQPALFSDMVFRSPGISEDCLYLNVWTPAKRAGEKLPVLVYFYGGGYLAGDSSEPRYDGESMAKRGVVVVTLNYRLGPFGFFSYPELTRESGGKGAGDQGLLDQVAALRWVRKNIARFGGDPSRVTIGGESAGSFSVSAQMASPLAAGLFQGAIGESGSLLDAPKTVVPLAVAEQRGEATAAALGATSLAALRQVPADRLLAIATQPEATPVVAIDGWFLPGPPDAIYASGRQAHVPLLAGSNSAEFKAGFLLGDQPPTLAGYRAALAQRFGAQADAVLALYPAASDADVPAAADALASDVAIALGTWRWVDLASRTGGKPVYYYLFAQPRPATVAEPDKPGEAGAVHSAEIEYALGNLDLNKVYAWTPADRAASALFQGYFADFIRTGNPNGVGLPAWPPYRSGEVMRITPTPAPVPDPLATRRAALDRIVTAQAETVAGAH